MKNQHQKNIEIIAKYGEPKEPKDYKSQDLLNPERVCPFCMGTDFVCVGKTKSGIKLYVCKECDW